MSEQVWRYLPRGRVKHALRPSRLRPGDNERAAACGCTPSWPGRREWLADPDTLERLPKCLMCQAVIGECPPPRLLRRLS